VQTFNKVKNKSFKGIGTYFSKTHKVGDIQGTATSITVAGVEEPTVAGFINNKHVKDGDITDIIENDNKYFKLNREVKLTFCHKIVAVKSMK